jgi:hypothetical protein
MARQHPASPTGTDGGYDETPRATGSRPDPRKLRLLLGGSGVAALSVLITGMVVPPAPAVSVPASPPAAPTTVTQQRPIVYIQLAPGQSPPPGASVIDAKAPKPITIVTRVPAPPRQTVVVRTTQSGKVIP